MTTLTQQKIEELQYNRQAVDLTVPEENGFRNHLGASQIGHSCDRYLWNVLHHAFRKRVEARMVRLWDRGHKEEPRFVRMLESIGIQVKAVDDNGKQFRCKFSGHGGGSCDGFGFGFPEYPEEWVLLEFKTHGEKSYDQLIKNGVKLSKPLHYAQMQVYMRQFGVSKAYYMAVNKNTDAIHTEWVYLDEAYADHQLNRAHGIIYAEHVPEKISESSAYYECRMCDFRPVCFHKEEPNKNCRTCKQVVANEDGTWGCKYNLVQDLDTSNPCSVYEKNDVFVKRADVTISLTLKK